MRLLQSVRGGEHLAARDLYLLLPRFFSYFDTPRTGIYR
jgi:hypothetical protein